VRQRLPGLQPLSLLFCCQEEHTPVFSELPLLWKVTGDGSPAGPVLLWLEETY